MRLDDFYFPENAVNGITDADYAHISAYIGAAKSFARSTHQCVYVMDYYRHSVLYVSDNLTRRFACRPDTAASSHRDLILDLIPPEEQQMILTALRAGFRYFDRTPAYCRAEWTLSFDFHLVSGQKRFLLRHHLTPLALAPSGRVWLALCTISISAGRAAGNVVMRRTGSRTINEFCPDTERWQERAAPVIGELERDIRQKLSSQWSLKLSRIVFQLSEIVF